jgi:hypothetical protein
VVAALVRRRAQARRSIERHLSFADPGQINEPPFTPATVIWTGKPVLGWYP